MNENESLHITGSKTDMDRKWKSYESSQCIDGVIRSAFLLVTESLQQYRVSSFGKFEKDGYEVASGVGVLSPLEPGSYPKLKISLAIGARITEAALTLRRTTLLLLMEFKSSPTISG